MTIRCYRNLHRKCWTVQHKTQKGWRVWYYAEDLCLENAKFVVNVSEQKRVRREGKKYVHAYVYGESPKTLVYGRWEKVTYNPYTHDFFMTKNGKIEDSEFVHLTSNGEVYVA